MTGTETRAQRARHALDPLLGVLAETEQHRTTGPSALGTGGQWRSLAAGIIAARAIIDAGIAVGFGHWVHAATVSYRDLEIGEGQLSTAIDSVESSTARTLTVRHSGRTLATGSVAFEEPPRGRHHPHLYGIGDAPDPHTVARDDDGICESALPLDVRPIDWAPLSARSRGLDQPVQSWFRYTDELPDDLLMHSAALALCVDPMISRNMVEINDYNAAEGNPAIAGWRPLTYSLWIHRCFRADDWILATESSASVFGNRAFFAVTLKSSQGRHVATAVQELQLLRDTPNSS